MRSCCIPRALGVALLTVSACSYPSATFSHDPIPLELAGSGGGLIGLGTAENRQLFPMLVDTGSPITSYDDGSGVVRVTRGSLQLYSSQFAFGEVPRFLLEDSQLFVSEFAGTGLDVANPVGGVLGGDNLHRFVLGLNYTPTPSITLTDALILEECELTDRCSASLEFSRAGGRQLIDIGEEVYSYPATYVLLDGCVEPALDPLEQALSCTDAGCFVDCPSAVGGDRDACLSRCQMTRKAGRFTCDDVCGNEASEPCRTCRADAQRYLSHGIDVRFAVATGFPGLALTASAYDRLRGRGAAAALFASTPHKLYLPEQTVDTTGLPVALETIGTPAVALHDDAARAAIALVGNAGFFGPCAELARSRRLRRVRPQSELRDPIPSNEVSCLRSRANNPEDPLIKACGETNRSSACNVCDDECEDAHTTEYVELGDPLQVIVVPDTTSLIQNINADVRPQSATVEGVIGTELLRRLGATIDYPKGRFVVTSADPSTRVYPRAGHGTDCAGLVPGEAADEQRSPFHVIPGSGCRLP